MLKFLIWKSQKGVKMGLKHKTSPAICAPSYLCKQNINSGGYMDDLRILYIYLFFPKV